MHNRRVQEAAYLLTRAWGPVILGGVIGGALIGDFLGLGIILISLVLAWSIFLFQDRLVFLPHAPTNIQQSVQKLSQRLGIAPPALYVLRSDTGNATTISGAFSSVVVLNSKVLDFRLDEIDALLAHELAHIKNQDVLSLMGVTTIIALVGINVVLGAVDKWALAAAVGLLPLMSWVMEFGADALGARACGDPSAMARLLQHLESDKKLVERITSYVIIPTLPLMILFALLSVNHLELSDLLMLSCGLAYTLPTHPPALFRIWRLRRMSLVTSAT